MKINQTLRNQLVAFFCLSALALLANWTYEYEFYVPSTAENRSIFESLPEEVGQVTYWAAGWPIKYYYKTEYQGLPSLTAYSGSKLIINVLCWSAFVVFFVFYESHLKKVFAVKSTEGQPAKSRMSLFDLFTITALIAGVLVYWRWQEGISAAEARLANEITTLSGKQKGTVSLGVFLPKKLQDLPDYIRLRFQRLLEINLENPPAELVEKSLKLPYLVRLNVTGGNYDLRKLVALREKPFLRSLRIAARKVDPELVGLVASLHQVEILNLMRTNITASAIQALGSMPRLRHLSFMHTDVKLSELGTPGFIKTLRFLETGHPEPGVSDELRLDGWPELLQLSCIEYEVKESNSPLSLDISNLPKLRQIILDTLAVYELKLDNLPDLQKIDTADVQRNRRFTQNGDGSIAHRLRKITLGNVPLLATLQFFSPALEEIHFTSPCETSIQATTAQWLEAPNADVNTVTIPANRLRQWFESFASVNGPRKLAVILVDLRSVDLAPLAQSPRLEYLNLDYTRLRDDQVLQLRGAPQLQELRVGSCGISGSAITTLVESLPKLQKIFCDARTVGRIKLENFPELQQLFGPRSMHIQPIDALKLVGLKSLSEAYELPRELFYLHIEEMPAMSGLTTCGPWPEKAVFKGVRDLRFFTAGGPHVTDALVEQLLNCEQLESLTLAYSNVSPGMLAKLGQLTKIKYLALTGSQVDDTVVAALAPLSSLQSLHLDDTKITDQSMDTLTQFKQLSKLTIGNTQVTDNGLGKLLDNKVLEALGCSSLPIGPQTARAFASLSSLRALDLSHCTLKPDSFAPLYGLNSLRTLNLSGCEVPKRSLMELARQLPELKFDLADANIEQQALLELASIDRVTPEFDDANPIFHTAEAVQQRAVIQAGGRVFPEYPVTARLEIDPQMFAPNWSPPIMANFGMGSSPPPMQMNMELRRQMMLQQQQGMQAESVEIPSMEPMSIAETIGYVLGQTISGMFSSSTSY